jgi:hypothetical protein
MDDSLTTILLQLQQFSAAKLKEAQTPCLRQAVSPPPAPLIARPTQPKPEVAKVIAERAKIAKQIHGFSAHPDRARITISVRILNISTPKKYPSFPLGTGTMFLCSVNHAATD